MWFADNNLYYFVSQRADPKEVDALGFIALSELLQVVVISQASLEFDLICERRRWNFRAESMEDFLLFTDFLAGRCAVRKDLFPIEGFVKKKGDLNKAMKRRYLRQVGANVYYFKSKQQAMNLELARGSIDLNKVVSVAGQALNLTDAAISITSASGRVYHLEVPIADFDRSLKGFAGFSPQVFVSQWPLHWNARVLSHSCDLIHNSPSCLNLFIKTLFSRSNSSRIWHLVFNLLFVCSQPTSLRRAALRMLW